MQKFLRLILLLRYIPFLSIRKYHSKNADVVIWVYSQYPNKFLNYLMSGNIVRELALIKYFVKNKIPFKLFFGRKIGEIYHKKIFFRLGGNSHNFFGFSDFPSILPYLVQQLAMQGNQVFPTKEEVALWQNKEYMHELFDRLQINTPKTEITSLQQLIQNSNLHYPFLIKTFHSSASAGLYKISSLKDLKALNTPYFNSHNSNFLKQELINMKKDIRVILVGEEIVLHYWRINNSQEWKPTSTSFGSMVDFVTFPEQWRKHIIDTFRKLKITTGAFDITWENDDTSTPPIFLEISSEYMPNPPIEKKLESISYSQYKKRIRWRNSYQENFFKITFEIIEKELKYREKCSL